MIVFYYLISFILIIISTMTVVLAFSSITLEVKKLKIKDANAISSIINDAIEKQYTHILQNIEILIKVKINIFNFFTINIITIDNKKIKNMIEKNIGKIQVTPKDKEVGKLITNDLINNDLHINKINIDMELGLHNAHYTALASTFIIIFFAIGLNFITEDRIKVYKNEDKQEKYINKNFKYKVTPIYSDNIAFKLQLNFKITLKIRPIIKKVLMYKYNLFVNNTNKYKVKES